MASNNTSGKGICILSLDSGGPGTYSQLLILKEYMSRLAMYLGVSEDEVYPADYFDLMGGVGFGGLVALLLGHLRMNLNEAIDTLIEVASAVFPKPQPTINREINTKALNDAIEAILEARNIPVDTKMNDLRLPTTKCKVVLYAATSARINHPQAFRTYPPRGSSPNPTIVEAICATMAIPSYFSPVKIGQRLREQSFVGGAIDANNPTRELLREAATVFGNDQRVAQILSIGSGIPPTLSLKSGTDDANFSRILKSIATDCEGVAQELRTRLYNIQAYLRLNVERGMEDIGFDDWGELGAIESHTGPYITATPVSESIDTSLRHLRERIGGVTLGQVNQSSSIKLTVKTAPAVSPHYVPRTGPWNKMVYHLVSSDSSRQKIFPITGMGGCGKTQVVSYFLQEHPVQYTRVVFVDASSSYSVQSDLQAWAQSFGDGHERDVWEDAMRLLSNLPPNERWMLILDNADDPSLNLVPFIPKNPSLTVILTSRNRDLRNLSTTYHLELGEMEPDEALATLLRAAQREQPLPEEEMRDAQRLIKELGFLAVALVQAGTYCHQLSSQTHDTLHPYTFTQYLSLFFTHRAELMKHGQPAPLDNYERGVYTTLDLSYRVLPQQSREFLHFVSFFHHSDIPLATLAAAARNKFSDAWPLLPRPEGHERIVADLATLSTLDGQPNELHVQEMIRNLRSFSLISATSIGYSLFLQMHPLLQAWSRDMIRDTAPAMLQHYRAMVIQALTSCNKEDAVLLHRHTLPHTLDILGQMEIQEIHVNDLMGIANVLETQGYYRKATELVEAALKRMTDLVEQNAKRILMVTKRLAGLYRKDGRWDEAEKMLVDVLEQRRGLLGTDDASTIRAAAGLATTYSKQGRWSEAEKLMVQVLEQQKRLLGMEHPDTILAAGNLASTYSKQGRWSEAEKLMVQVLEQQKRLLGMEHPDTILAAGNLASIYSKQGRWSEAEKLKVQVLEQRKRLLGMEHPDTILAAGNLASTYSKQGRWSEAEKLMVQVLEQRKRLLGMEHPHTILAAENLAATYRSQGQWSEAEKLQAQVLEQRKRVLGMEHPDTIRAAANLASTYSHQGRWSEAEKLGVQVLEQRKRVLGMEHPDTIIAAGNLASTYHSQGRWSEAEKLNVQVLEQRKRVLGMEHPDTTIAAANLASTCHSQGRWSEAEKLGIQVLEQRKRLLGMEHPDTIRAAANLASTYSHQGRWSEAEKLGVQVLEQRKRVLGMEHPDTIIAAGNLASTYHSQGRWSEAEKLNVQVLEQRKRVLGMEHPDTTIAAANLASTCHSQGRWSEAEKLGIQVLEQRKRLLGMEHPDTIRAAANLASTYSHQGRWSEAEKLGVQVLEQRKRVLGMEHPDTIIAAGNLASTYHSQGRWSEAEKLNVQVLEQRKRVLGMEHPDTTIAAANLASTCHSQGRWSEAEKLGIQVLEQRKRLLGMEHPDTIRAAANLAATYRSQGRWSEAESLEVQVLEQRTKLLGMEHPDTLLAAANLAVTYYTQGRLNEAATLLAQAVELGVKVLGQQHPNTQHYVRLLVGFYETLGKVKEAEETRALLLS